MSVQDYIDHALGSLPKWFSNRIRAFENIKAFAEMFQDSEDQSSFWRTQANILNAVGATTGEPDWLQQHGADRGTRRQENETDVAMRDRLRTFPDALNLMTLLSSAQSIVDAEGVSGTVFIVELRPNRAFFRTMTSQTGTGGTFALGTSPQVLFQPTAGFSPLVPKYDGVTLHKLVISGASNPANDGTFDITGVSDDSVTFDNGSGVAGADPTVSWAIQKFAGTNIIDGFRQTYLSRGHRIGSIRPTIVVILPFGCTEGTRLSVLEMLRQKKGAGVQALVECRTSP